MEKNFFSFFFSYCAHSNRCLTYANFYFPLFFNLKINSFFFSSYNHTLYTHVYKVTVIMKTVTKHNVYSKSNGKIICFIILIFYVISLFIFFFFFFGRECEYMNCIMFSECVCVWIYMGYI